MTYKYKRPDGELHKISILKWNKHFAKRGTWPFIVVEVYLQEDKAIVHYVVSWQGKILFILLLPFIFVYASFFQGVPATLHDLRGVLQDKKLGRFSSDLIYSRNNGWDKLLKLIGKEKQ